MRFEIEDKGPVVGLADLAHELYPSDGFYQDMPLDDLPTPLDLAVAAGDAGIGPAAVEMALLDASRFSGVTPRRQFGKSATRRLGTWLHLATKEQRPKEKVTVPWFAAHVPRGGRVRARHTTKRTRGGKFGLNVFGSTLFRAGRSLDVTAYDDTNSRKVCSVASVILKGTPTRYHFGGKESEWGLEDLTVVGQRRESLNPCPFCSIKPNEIDLTKYDAGMLRDHRNDQDPSDFGGEYIWKKNFAFSVPIPILIPHAPPMIVNIGFVAATAVTWNLDWTLAGGYTYQEYRRKDVREIPPMWAVEL
ncbi:MAG: hypothetical protein WA484_04720 [Solirubrobacteraceae bacterium]